MNLKNIVIVLVRPDECRNVGAACRAMANNDISTLRIVGKKADYDTQKVHTLALHAAPIFDHAEYFDSVTAATADCTLSVGTTRRRGKKRGKLLLPEEFSAHVSAFPPDAKVAVVFGNERTGLTDGELDECTLGVTIPSSDSFGSLNLSHAVQLMCYQLFRESRPGLKGFSALSLERLDTTVTVMADSLQETGFFKLAGRADMENFWRSVLSRAAISEGEAQYIEKTFAKIAGLHKKNS